MLHVPALGGPLHGTLLVVPACCEEHGPLPKTIKVRPPLTPAVLLTGRVPDAVPYTLGRSQLPDDPAGPWVYTAPANAAIPERCAGCGEAHGLVPDDVSGLDRG